MKYTITPAQRRRAKLYGPLLAEAAVLSGIASKARIDVYLALARQATCSPDRGAVLAEYDGLYRLILRTAQLETDITALIRGRSIDAL